MSLIQHPVKEGCHILEIHNCRDDSQLSIARARVLPGTRTRSHFLHGITERYLILEGIGTVFVGSSSQSVDPGSVVFIPPGTPQAILNSGQQDLVFLALCTPRFSPSAYVEVS